VFEIKGRASNQALPLVAADAAQVARSLGPFTPAVERLVQRFWPGPLTILFRAPASLAGGVSAATGRVGVRVPAHEVARALCRAAGGLLIATSANRSGEPATSDPSVVASTLGDAIDALVDSGPTAGGAPSTIVDATGSELRLVRAGATPWEAVRACVEEV
jgi:L-threonylcarbamoyladenylate synthase